MAKRPDPFRIALFTLAGLVLSSANARAGANKFDLGFGFYSFTAKTSTGSGSNSGLGLYSLNFRRAITPRFELALGYTVYFSKLVSGDSGSGLDLGMNFYPLTFSGPVEASGEGTKIELEQLWRPYIGATFNQRNFQSVQTTYTGFGVAVGLERVLNETMNLNALFRYLKLNGARGSTGSEMNTSVGISLKF
ncbi:MAG: hypothetical protein JST04_10985 [Bdellovibrionales bacterium]|nr:hypothetical protein [Bdellovibrionales bacterium]